MGNMTHAVSTRYLIITRDMDESTCLRRAAYLISGDRAREGEEKGACVRRNVDFFDFFSDGRRTREKKELPRTLLKIVGAHNWLPLSLPIEMPLLRSLSNRPAYADVSFLEFRNLSIRGDYVGDSDTAVPRDTVYQLRGLYLPIRTHMCAPAFPWYCATA